MADFDPKTDILNNAINEEGWQILDVRNADELQNDGNLKDQGANNWVHISKPDVEAAVSNGTFETEIAPKLSKSSKIVVHCRSGKRSAVVTGILTGHGYDAVNYDGGYTKWKDNFTACTLPS